MSADQLKNLAREYFHQAWTVGNVDVIDRLVAPDVIVHGLGPEALTDRELFKTWYSRFRNAFSNVDCPVTHCLVEGDWTTIRVRFTGTHTGPSLGPPPSGKQVTLTALVLARWKDGRVVESFNEFDQLSLLHQINALPRPTSLPLPS
jgi:predicted ester cyclase